MNASSLGRAALIIATVYVSSLLIGYVTGLGTVRRHHVETAAYLFVAVAIITTLLRHDHVVHRHAIDEGRPAWIVAVVLIVGSFVVYGQSIRIGLLSDDFVLVERALNREWMAAWEFFRPAPTLMWSALLSVSPTPELLHAFSVFLHGLNASLVWLLGKTLGLSRDGAIFSGLLFLAYPSSVETVTWPSAVHDLLAAACCLGVVLLSAGGKSITKTVAGALILALGLLSKESAVAIPAVAAALWVVMPEPRRTHNWVLIVIATAIASAYAVVRVIGLDVPETYAQVPSRYLLKELLARTVGTLALPWTRSAMDQWPAIVSGWALIPVCAVAAYAQTAGKSVPPAIVIRCLLAALIAVLPVYSMLYVTEHLENGRYVYLSTAFWVLALAALIDRSQPGSHVRIRIALCALIVLVATLGVHWHLGPWKTAAAIRDRVLVSAERAVQETACRTVSLTGAADTHEGAYVFRNGLEEAIILSMTNVTSVTGVGECIFVWNGREFVRDLPAEAAIQATVAIQRRNRVPAAPVPPPVP